MEMIKGLGFEENTDRKEKYIKVVFWKKHMGYRLLNPCEIVYAYHIVYV